MTRQQEITDINEYRRQRRRAGSARWALIFVFLVVCAVAGYFFARSNFFAITSIQVEGAEQVSEERLIQLAAVGEGMNIFSFSPRHSSQWLFIEPYVKSGQVKRRLPHTVLISVEERRPAALLSVGHAVAEIDAEGRVLSRYPLQGALELPLISGVDLSSSGTVPGSFVDAEGMEEALEILAALPADAVGIGEIDVSNPQFICLYTTSGTEIRLGGSEDFAAKYVVYSNILSNVKSDGHLSLEYVDVSIYTDPVIKSH